jgi:hypothetical protein
MSTINILNKKMKFLILLIVISLISYEVNGQTPTIAATTLAATTSVASTTITASGATTATSVSTTSTSNATVAGTTTTKKSSASAVQVDQFVVFILGFVTFTLTLKQ